MIRDAEANAAEDKKRKQEIETRNEADSLVYRVDRQIREMGDRVPVHEKARIEQILGDLKSALKENAPIERISSLYSDLQQAAYSLSEAAYRQTQAGTPPPGEAQKPPGHGPDDVVDAEYEEKDLEYKDVHDSNLTESLRRATRTSHCEQRSDAAILLPIHHFKPTRQPFPPVPTEIASLRSQ